MEQQLWEIEKDINQECVKGLVSGCLGFSCGQKLQFGYGYNEYGEVIFFSIYLEVWELGRRKQMLKFIQVWGLVGQVQRNKKNVRELGIFWELVLNGWRS